MIRPIDLQNALFAVQNSTASVRAESAQRVEVQAAQAAFAAERERHAAEVAATVEVSGNRIGSKRESDAHEHKRRGHKPRNAFEAVVDEAAGSSEEPAHLVDYTA